MALAIALALAVGAPEPPPLGLADGPNILSRLAGGDAPAPPAGALPAEPVPAAEAMGLHLTESGASLPDLLAAGAPALLALREPGTYAVVVGGDETWAQLVTDRGLTVWAVEHRKLNLAGTAWRLAAPDPAGPAPRIELAAPHVLVDKAYLGLEIRHSFTIHNAGEAALRVSSLGASCSCTKAISDALVIEPGADGEFEAQLRIIELGEVHEHLWLRTIDPLRPRVPLTFTAQSAHGVRWYPSTIRLSATKAGGE